MRSSAEIPDCSQYGSNGSNMGGHKLHSTADSRTIKCMEIVQVAGKPASMNSRPWCNDAFVHFALGTKCNA